jgi:chorismate dehydratase
VDYLNVRPLVYGLDRLPDFQLRYDLPARCARLLHDGDIDLGMIPSIEYLRGDGYRLVPDLAIASRGAVASVALYTTRAMAGVRSIAMDTSSRTSVALVRVLCARLFHITPSIEALAPDLPRMLAQADAALVIGDNALLWDPAAVRLQPDEAGRERTVEKIDLGQTWTAMTGLPFVWAFWAGRAGAIDARGVRALQHARNEGVAHAEQIGRDYFRDSPELQDVGARYLRDNIKCSLGPDERAGLETFYRYAAEAGLVPATRELVFFDT